MATERDAIDITVSTSTQGQGSARAASLARKRRLAALFRWLHIYLSMVSFAIVLFFAVTGLTLNHADMFQHQIHAITEKGKMNAAWTNSTDTNKIDKLHIVEYLRETHGIRAALGDLGIDDSQIRVSFKGPGCDADAFINRDNGAYELTTTSAGFVGLINDLHKGRDTGKIWPIVIDVSAVLLTLVSLTGIVLLLYLKKKRFSGLLVAALGLLLVYIMYKIFI
jgi:uncharacterized protein